jgi:proline dehydrogenase
MIPPIASRFVAGETERDVLAHARALDAEGIGSICNLLGEHYDSPEPAAEDREAYCALIEAIGEAGVAASVSVKPSQLGLGISEECFRSNLELVVERAAEQAVFLWIDMEDHETTDATLDAYTDHVEEYEAIGVCVQANLKRTPEDLHRLADHPGKVRLVKGAYDEPAEVAHREKSRVDEAYRECLDVMFAEFDGGIAVGSHDPAMVEYAKELHDTSGTDFEIQMLMGVREGAQRDLAEQYEVHQYVPYGDRWFSYFYRRMMERRENLLFGLRALVGR